SSPRLIGLSQIVPSVPAQGVNGPDAVPPTHVKSPARIGPVDVELPALCWNEKPNWSWSGDPLNEPSPSAERTIPPPDVPDRWLSASQHCGPPVGDAAGKPVTVNR